LIRNLLTEARILAAHLDKTAGDFVENVRFSLYKAGELNNRSSHFCRHLPG
jgi:monomeric isocitrate dehydrogenase